MDRDDLSDDPELRKYEREMEFRELQMEHMDSLLKEAPKLLSEIVNEVVLPLAVQMQSQDMSRELWDPPNDSENFRSEFKSETPNTQVGAEKQADNVRSKPDFDPTENGGEDA